MFSLSHSHICLFNNVMIDPLQLANDIIDDIGSHQQIQLVNLDYRPTDIDSSSRGIHAHWFIEPAYDNLSEKYPRIPPYRIFYNSPELKNAGFLRICPNHDRIIIPFFPRWGDMKIEILSPFSLLRTQTTLLSLFSHYLRLFFHDSMDMNPPLYSLLFPNKK